MDYRGVLEHTARGYHLAGPVRGRIGLMLSKARGCNTFLSLASFRNLGEDGYGSDNS